MIQFLFSFDQIQSIFFADIPIFWKKFNMFDLQIQIEIFELI